MTTYWVIDSIFLAALLPETTVLWLYCVLEAGFAFTGDFTFAKLFVKIGDLVCLPELGTL